MHSQISDELVQAYKNTDYHVTTDIPFILNINKYSHALEEVHLKNGYTSSAFLTAYSPFSKLLSIEENEKLQNLLESELTAINFQFFSGYGQGRGTHSDWKERSVLVLGITLDEATRLAKKYEQNAFVWNDYDSIPKLLLTVK